MVEDEWHLQIAGRVRANLEKKGIIANPEKSERLYKRTMPTALAAYGLEVIYGMHAAITTVDPESGKPTICLNPYFTEYSPGFQMQTLIEEAIHVHQLHQHPGGLTTRHQYLQDEIEARNKLLRIKKFLRLKKLDIQLMENQRAYFRAELNRRLEQRGISTSA